MSFRYLDRIATNENIHSFLELADLAAGAGASASNVFLLSHRLRDSNPMKVCRTLLARDPASRALMEQRRLCGPYDLESLKALPKGSLGHTYATVLDTMGYDINFFPKLDFYAGLESEADYINYRVYATHDIHHIVSGFSLDNFGELGVISLSVAQFAHPGLAFTDLMALLLNLVPQRHASRRTGDGGRAGQNGGLCLWSHQSWPRNGSCRQTALPRALGGAVR
ncbi:MAG: Coq4 family protein [Synechococcaceae cyanobacterium ELA263]